MKKAFIAATALLSVSFVFGGGDIVPVEPVSEIPLSAESTNYNVALKGGTLGAGLDISHMLNDYFAIRANINGLTYDDTRDVSDLSYDADLNLFTIGLLGDYYPFENNFRVSAGVYYNDNHADGTFIPAAGSSFEFGGHTYTSSQIGRIDTSADYDDNIAPYIGIGWGNKSDSSGWGFTFDVGALYQGSTQIHTNPTINNSVPDAIKNQIKNDIEIERQQVEDDIDDYKWYPVIMIGANYSS
jgi:hypothetical protein